MTKHSDGPWESYFSVHGEPSVVTDANRPAFTKICDVSTAPSDYGQANCRLIAAAPDMLEALRDSVRLIKHMGGNAKFQEDAIVKAEGGEGQKTVQELHREHLERVEKGVKEEWSAWQFAKAVGEIVGRQATCDQTAG